MAGEEYWVVLYKAIADFGDLMRKAAEAKAALDAMSKSAGEASASQITGEQRLIDVRKQEIQALRDEKSAAEITADAYKRYNVQALYGGRSDMGSHLGDMQRQIEYTTLLNRQKWLLFSTPQQAYAWRQQEYQQLLLMNRAEWGGYASADQYLAYLQKQIGYNRDLNATMRDRAALYKQNADAALEYYNALSGTHKSIQQLAEGGSVAGLESLSAALAGLPSEVSTRVTIDDSQGMAQLLAWRAALQSIPRQIGSEETLKTVFEGGQFTPGNAVENVSVQFNDAQAQSELAKLVMMLNRIPSDVKVDVAFDDAKAVAEVDRFNAYLRKELDVRGIASETIVATGGAGGGGGGAPPPKSAAGAPDEPNPNDIRAMQQAEDALAMALIREHLAAQQAAAGDRTLAAGAQDTANSYDSARQHLLALSQTETDSSKAAYALAVAMQGTRDRTDSTTGSLGKLGAAAAYTTAGFAFFGTKLLLFAGAAGAASVVHFAIDGIIEALAILVPAIVTAAVALTAFGIGAYGTVTAIYGQMQNIVTVSKALNQTIPPLNNGLQNLTNAVRPQTMVLFGEGLILVNQQTGLLQKIATATGQVLDRMGSRFINDLNSNSGAVAHFLQVGAENLAKLGMIVANVGHFLDGVIVATQKTHLDQFFLDAAVALSKLLALFGDLLHNPVAAWMFAVVVALHGIWLWGGGAATVVLGLVRSLALFAGGSDAAGTALALLSAKASGLERLKAIVTDIGTGFAALPGRIGLFGKASSEAGSTASSAEKSIAEESAAMSGAGVAASGAAGKTGLLTKAGSALMGLGWVGWGIIAAAAIALVALKLSFMSDATQTWLNKLTAVLHAASIYQVVGVSVQQLAAVTTQLGLAQSKGVGNVSELASAHHNLQVELGTELSRVGQVSKAYGVDFVGALELLNAAGAKSSDLYTSQTKIWVDDLIQVNALVRSYAAMGQQAGIVGSDLNALNVQASDQVTQMQKLNGAWDQFISTVSGPVTTFLTLQGSLNTLQADASTAGASMVGLGKNVTTAAAATAGATPTITNAANQLQSQFQTTLGSVEQMFDAFRNAQALNGGQGNFIQFVKDAVAAMIPFTGGNKAAVAQLSALAQEAGGPATTNVQSLTKWVGNIKNPLQAMYSASQAATIGTSNLNYDAQLLSNTLQQDLNPAMANAIFNAEGGQKPFQDMAAAFRNGGGGTAAFASSAKAVAAELIAVTGSSKAAQPIFVGFAEKLGLSSAAANALWVKTTSARGGVDNLNKGSLSKLRDELGKTYDASANLGSPGLWGQIEHAFMAAWDGMVNWFANTWPHAFEHAWDSTFHWFSSNVPAFFGSVWSKIWSNLVAPVINGFEDVKHAITNGFDGWWKTHGDEVKAVWTAVWTNLSGIAKGAFDAVKTVALGFWGWITGLFGGKHGFLADIWTGFQESGKQAWQWIKVAAQDAWATIQAIFKVIASVAKAVWDGMATGFKAAWDVFAATVKVVWDVIVGIVSVALDLITGHWGRAWDDMKLAALQVWNAVKTAADQVWNAIKTGADQLWNVLFKPVVTFFNENVVQPLGHFFTSTLPGWLRDIGTAFVGLWNWAWDHFNSIVISPLAHFFVNTLPGWLRDIGTAFVNLWNWSWDHFNSIVISPIAHFFTSTLPGWLNDIGRSFVNLWNWAWDHFNSIILQPLLNFFTRTLPGWLADIGRDYLNLWTYVWNHFFSGVISPMTNFFTRTLPGWLGDIGRSFQSLWENVSTWFTQHVAQPVGNWFTRTMPSAVENAFKGAINWVITNVINKAIGFINDVTGIVGVHIKPVGTLAAGGQYSAGSVPGPADSDNYNAKLMGGEYIIRQPARMALEQQYGQGYMNWLNHYDQWSGSGSRGTLASQGGAGKYATGGYPALAMAAGGACGPMGCYQDGGPAGVPEGNVGMRLFANGGQIERNMLDFMENKIGHPYLAQNPQRFGPLFYDCSGLVYEAAIQAGVPLPRGDALANLEAEWFSSYDGDYTYRGNNNIATGDILFFTGADPGPSRFGGIGHTGMAATPTTLVSAYDTQRGVCETPISQDGFVVGVRLGGAKANAFPVTANPGGGLFQSLGQILGFLNPAGDLTKAASVLGKLVKGGAKEVLSLLGTGAEAVFNGMWDFTVNPLLNLLPGGPSSVVGAVGHTAADEIKKGVDNFLTGKDSAARATQAAEAATGFGAGPAGTATAGSEFNNLMAVARYMMQHGATRAAAAGIAGDVFGESSGNPEVHGGGAFGLIEWTGNTLGLPAGYNGPTGNATKDLDIQLGGILGYIQARGGMAAINGAGNDVVSTGDRFSLMLAPQVRYSDTRPGVAQQVYSALGGGNPSQTGNVINKAAQGHQGGATGGPVISAIKQLTGNQELQEAMSFGSWLMSRWQDTWHDSDHDQYGPFGITTNDADDRPPVRGRFPTVKEAENPLWAAKYMLPSFTTAIRDVGQGAWKNPMNAALSVINRTPMKGQFGQNQTGDYSAGWNDVRDVLGLNAATLPKTGSTTGAGTPEVTYQADVAKLQPAWDVFFKAFSTLRALKRPSGVTNEQWAGWVNDINYNTQIEGNIGEWLTDIWKDPNSPSAGTWFNNTRGKDISSMGGFLAGYGPATTTYAGTGKNRHVVPYSSYVARARYPKQFLEAKTSFDTLAADILAAQAAQSAIPVAPPPSITPGAVKPPPATTAESFDVLGAIMGGPGGQPLPASLSAGGTYSLSDVSGMFSGYAAGGPAFSISDVSAMVTAVQSSAARGREMPRTISDAAASTRVGVNVSGDININNPVPEQPSQSITRASNRLAFLAGRGPV